MRLCLRCKGLIKDGSRCDRCRKAKVNAYERTRAPYKKQRYDQAHRQLRRQFVPLVNAGLMNCCRCGLTIEPGEPFDLDHHPLKGSWPAHQSCNRSAWKEDALNRQGLTMQNPDAIGKSTKLPMTGLPV